MSSSTLSAGAKADKAPAAAKKTPAKTPAGAKPVPPSSSKLASSGPLAGKATSKPATPAPGKPSSAQLQKGGALPISAASKKVGTPPVHAPSPLSQPPVTASKAPKPSPTTAPPKPAHGYKPNSTYEAPNGFQFTPVYHDKVKSEAGLSPFDARHLADDDGNPLKELWLIKVPPGVSAEDLKDLKFDPLLKDGTLGKGKVNGTKHELVVLPPADRGEMSELEPLVPSFDAGEDDGGGMVFAPVTFSRYLSLVPASSVPQGIADGAVPKIRERKHPPGMGSRTVLPIGAITGDSPKDSPRKKEKKKDRPETAPPDPTEAPGTATPKGILSKRKDVSDSEKEKDKEKKSKKKVRISDVS